MTIPEYIAAFFITCTALVCVLAMTAPVGHETDEGWFPGEPDEHALDDNLGI